MDKYPEKCFVAKNVEERANENIVSDMLACPGVVSAFILASRDFVVFRTSFVKK